MNKRKDPAGLSLRQQFTSAALGLTAGMAAAFGVHEAVTPLFAQAVQFPLGTFLATYGVLFAVTGGTMGYIDETFRQANSERHKHAPWGMKPGLWK